MAATKNKVYKTTLAFSKEDLAAYAVEHLGGYAEVLRLITVKYTRGDQTYYSRAKHVYRQNPNRPDVNGNRAVRAIRIRYGITQAELGLVAGKPNRFSAQAYLSYVERTGTQADKNWTKLIIKAAKLKKAGWLGPKTKSPKTLPGVTCQ